MPLVEIKVFEDELSEAETKEVIQKVTDVMISFAGENLRQGNLGHSRGSEERPLGSRGQSSRSWEDMLNLNTINGKLLKGKF